MCFYVTLVFPNETDLNEVRSLAGDKIGRALGLGLTPIRNPSIERHLRAGEITVLRGGGGAACDCGTALGSRRRAALQNAEDGREKQSGIERKANRLRREGWSEAKVAKWAAQKERAAARHVRQDGEAIAEDWRALLTRVLDFGVATRVGLLLHWFDGAVETEEIQLKRVRVDRHDVTADLLADLEEDVLYEFVGDRRRNG